MRANRLDNQPNPAKSEEIEKTRVQVQLLQAQVNLSQQALTSSIDQLARAEIAVTDEAGQNDKLDIARKNFEKVQMKHVESSKRLRDELTKLTELDPQAALNFGGGMGGMGGGGGGFR